MSPKQKVWNAALAAGLVSLVAALIAPPMTRALMSRAGVDWHRVSDGDRLDVLVGLLVGIPGLVVGLLGAYLAWLAIRMGRENERVTASQVEILGKLEGLEAKQAAMLERQYEVFERELKRRAVLKLLLPRPPMASGDGPTKYELFLTNDGDKAGTGFWYLGVPKRMRGRVSCEPRHGNEEVLVAGDNWDIIGGFDQPLVTGFTDDFFLMKFRVTVPVEPGVLLPCGTLSVQLLGEAKWADRQFLELSDQAGRILGWFTNGPSGRFPERGMLKLRLYSRGESWFKNYHGGLELPQDDPDEFP